MPSYSAPNSINSVDEIDSNNILSIYPNPSHSQVFLHIESPENTTGTIELLDGSGRIIFSETAFYQENFTTQIDVSQFRKGMYFLRWTSKDIIQHKKLIVN
jgi:hypothetical protein